MSRPEKERELKFQVMRGGKTHVVRVTQQQLAALQNEEAKVYLVEEALKSTRAALMHLASNLGRAQARYQKLYRSLTENVERGAEIEDGPIKAFMKRTRNSTKLVVK